MRHLQFVGLDLKKCQANTRYERPQYALGSGCGILIFHGSGAKKIKPTGIRSDNTKQQEQVAHSSGKQNGNVPAWIRSDCIRHQEQGAGFSGNPKLERPNRDQKRPYWAARSGCGIPRKAKLMHPDMD